MEAKRKCELSISEKPDSISLEDSYFHRSDADESEDWVDTAVMRPQCLGRVRVNIRSVRPLQFSSAPGEFSFENTQNE